MSNYNLQLYTAKYKLGLVNHKKGKELKMDWIGYPKKM